MQNVQYSWDLVNAHNTFSVIVTTQILHFAIASIQVPLERNPQNEMICRVLLSWKYLGL